MSKPSIWVIARVVLVVPTLAIAPERLPSGLGRGNQNSNTYHRKYTIYLSRKAVNEDGAAADRLPPTFCAWRDAATRHRDSGRVQRARIAVAQFSTMRTVGVAALASRAIITNRLPSGNTSYGCMLNNSATLGVS